MRNVQLNDLIAREFAKNANQVLHYFRLGDADQTRTEYQPPGAEPGKVYADVAEIRGSSSFFYISAIRGEYIDILTVQSSWLKPRYRGSREKPIALGDT